MVLDRMPVGIDFGTSKSVIAYYTMGGVVLMSDSESQPALPGGEIMRRTPTLLATRETPTAPRLRIGWRVYTEKLLRSSSIVRNVKLRLAGREATETVSGEKLKPYEAAGLFLKSLHAKFQQQQQQSIQEVVLTIPANFGVNERQALLAAAQIAGFTTVHLINEPTAAALHYAMKAPDMEETILVFDFGGGTLDISILEKRQGSLRVINTHGDPELGGYAFDDAMISLLRRKISVENPGIALNENESDLYRDAEQCKFQYSASGDIYFSSENIGVLDGRSVPCGFEITGTEYREQIAPLLDRARACLQTTLQRSGLTHSQIHRIIPVGGTVRLPDVQAMLHDEFGAEKCSLETMNDDRAPFEAVASGACLYAAQLQGKLQQQIQFAVEDVAGRGIGLKMHESGPDSPFIYKTLVTADARVPYSYPGKACLVTPEQTWLNMELYEADVKQESKRLDEIEKKTLLAQGEILDIVPLQGGQVHGFDYQFHYDQSGIVTFSATLDTGEQATFTQKGIIKQKDIEIAQQKVQILLDSERPGAGPGKSTSGTTSTLPSLTDTHATAPGQSSPQTNGIDNVRSDDIQKVVLPVVPTQTPQQQNKEEMIAELNRLRANPNIIYNAAMEVQALLNKGEAATFEELDAMLARLKSR